MAGRRRNKVIRRARALHFRRGIHEATESSEGIWKLAKWAKDRNQKPRELPKFPSPQKDQGGYICSFEEQVKELSDRFFPPQPEVGLSDIDPSQYPPQISDNLDITEEVKRAIRLPKQDKAPGPDGIPNRYLRILEQE